MSVRDKDLTRFTIDAIKEYAREVVCNRAIPDYRDGLKPVQRVILWQMHLSKLYPTAKHMKLAKLSGQCMTFHPHGDGSIDAAAMNMSQPWARRTPFVDIHGNNGSIDGSNGAASRYVEARMAKAASYMFANIDEDAVDIIDNYDNTAKIASVLPAEYPVMMSNGASGIGFGLATSILPHNPAELVDLMLLELKGDLTPAAAKEVYHGPDFPTGRYVTGDPHAELTSTSASYKVYADVSVDSGGLTIKGVPYGVSSTAMIESIAAMIESLNLQYVTDIIDLTENNDVTVKIECRKGTDKSNLQALADMIRTRSKASASVSASNICIVNNQPKALTLLKYIKLFTRFRLDVMRRVYAHRLNKARARLPIIECELYAAANTDLIKQLLDEATDENDFAQRINNATGLTIEQSKHIANMKLSRLLRNGQHLESLREEKAQLESNINLLNGLIESPKAAADDLANRLQVIRQELAKMFPRQSQFIDASAIEPADNISIGDIASTASSERVVIETDGLTVQIRKRASDDQSVQRLECMSNDIILLFTNRGHLLRVQPDLLPLDSEGRITVPGFQHDERVMLMCEYSSKLRVISVTKHGYIKHSHVSKCLPDKVTRANQLRLHTFNSCSGSRVRSAGLTDSVVYLNVYAAGHAPASLTIESAAARRVKQRSIACDWLTERNDGGGSAGACVAWSNNGKSPVTRVISI